MNSAYICLPLLALKYSTVLRLEIKCNGLMDISIFLFFAIEWNIPVEGSYGKHASKMI